MKSEHKSAEDLALAWAAGVQDAKETDLAFAAESARELALFEAMREGSNFGFEDFLATDGESLPWAVIEVAEGEDFFSVITGEEGPGVLSACE